MSDRRRGFHHRVTTAHVNSRHRPDDQRAIRHYVGNRLRHNAPVRWPAGLARTPFAYCVRMGAPTDDDRVEALRRFLAGLFRGDDANQLVADIADLHVPHNTFPGEVFMELAADALGVAGLERDSGVVYRELLSTFLPEVAFRGKEHRRIQYTVLAAYAVHGGLEPDLLDEVTYWIEQYWTYALYAAVAIVRACAASADIPLGSMLADLATKHAIDIA